MLASRSAGGREEIINPRKSSLCALATPQTASAVPLAVHMPRSHSVWCSAWLGNAWQTVAWVFQRTSPAGGLTPPCTLFLSVQVIGPDKHGIKTVIEYKIKEDGSKARRSLGGSHMLPVLTTLSSRGRAATHR